MHASRHAIFFLAFIVALVSAVPLHNHHRRSKCRRVTSSAVPTATNAAIAVPSKSATPSASGKYEGPKASAKPTSSSSSSDDNDDSGSSGSSSGGVVGGLLEALFPSGDSTSWTTSPDAKDALPLSDSTFRPTSEMDLPHPVVKAPDNKQAMKAHYPKGSYNFQHEPRGGFSFYAPGPSDVDLTTAKEATFGYSVFFPKGFEFQKGGKLPGIYGGNSASEAVSCSGGRRDDGCFSARLMWRGESKGELYTYLPPSFPENKKVCNVAPMSDCNDTYGASVGRGSFTFATGKWTTVSQRVKLNDPGKANGELQLWADGESVINVSGLILRNSAEGRMHGLQMQTFFGGSSPDFATPKDQDVYFSDFSVAITDKL